MLEIILLNSFYRPIERNKFTPVLYLLTETLIGENKKVCEFLIGKNKAILVLGNLFIQSSV
jgi:hypothetical protein